MTGIGGSQPGTTPALHVVMRKEDLDGRRIADKTVVVVDILFATTSIVAALDHGVSEVYPARDTEEAKMLAARKGMINPVLAGESMFRFIEGFATPTPLALCRAVDAGGTLIYTTTNGTVALRASSAARRVLVGSLVNAGATVDAILRDRSSTVVIVCAGTAGAFNLEDFYGAGCLVNALAGEQRHYRLTDAAIAARDYFRAWDPESTLRGSMVGRLMHEWGLDSEVGYAARIDATNVAAELRRDRVAVIC